MRRLGAAAAAPAFKSNSLSLAESPARQPGGAGRVEASHSSLRVTVSTVMLKLEVPQCPCSTVTVLH